MHQSMAPPPPVTTAAATYAAASSQNLSTGKTATNNASNTSSNQIEQSARGTVLQPHATAVAASSPNACSTADYASYFGHCSTSSASVDGHSSTVVSAMHGEHPEQQCGAPANKTQQTVRIQ